MLALRVAFWAFWVFWACVLFWVCVVFGGVACVGLRVFACVCVGLRVEAGGAWWRRGVGAWGRGVGRVRGVGRAGRWGVGHCVDCPRSGVRGAGRGGVWWGRGAAWGSGVLALGTRLVSVILHVCGVRGISGIRGIYADTPGISPYP